jgi:hypothetical protein
MTKPTRAWPHHEETAMSWWQKAAANNLTVERNPSTPAEVLAKLAVDKLPYLAWHRLQQRAGFTAS